MPSFQELRAKAEAAASSARTSLPSKTTKYEPYRPVHGTTDTFPTAHERAKQSTVLQLEASKHHPPSPPRRFGSASSEASTSAGPRVPAGLSAARGPPPAPARKPAGLAPPPLPVRKDSSPAPPYAPALPSRSPSIASSSAAEPVAPPYAAPPSPAPAPPLRRAPPSATSNVDSLSQQLNSSLSVHEPEQDPVQAGWKKFSEYDERDKQDFFAVLDQFFDSAHGTSPASAPPRAASPAPYLPPAAAPPVAHSTRPSLRPSLPSSALPTPSTFAPTPKPPELHAPSYPPPSSHSSSALSLLHWLHSTSFTHAWFVHTPGSSPLPPPLVGRSDMRYSAGWSFSSLSSTHTGVALFGDASIAWYRLTWPTSSEHAGRAHLDVTREGRYRPAPGPPDGQTLYAASETYGPLVCVWAERALAAGVPVARGECWDLANEALEHIRRDWPDLAPPFPSIGRTHGSLLFYANAARRDEHGRVLGTWTGGDVYVRAGDVVEWRKVRITTVGALPGGYSKLGDPDHTALILSCSAPLSLPTLSASLTDPSYPLSSLVSVTVLEQSLGKVPTVASYDLSAMSEGEVWIYRPCGMRTLCGVEEVEARWPDEMEVESWEMGELE
ncbi:hypothetical protein JCM10207_008817 [Rhodosporidiobolus poonsookiae]